MTIEKLERVMWRLTRNNNQNNIHNTYSNKDLQKAVMYEIGTDPRTYKTARKNLFKLKWITPHGTKHIKVTGTHITES